MSGRDALEAACIRPPRRSEPRTLASTNTTQVFRVPESWFGKKVRFEARGDTFWLQTHTSEAISIDPTGVDTITGTGSAAALSAARTDLGEPLVDGAWKEFDFVFGQDTFLGIRGSGAAAGRIHFRITETAIGAT